MHFDARLTLGFEALTFTLAAEEVRALAVRVLDDAAFVALLLQCLLVQLPLIIIEPQLQNSAITNLHEPFQPVKFKNSINYI